MPVAIEPRGGAFRITSGEDFAYLNPLVFQGHPDSELSGPAIQRLIDARPDIPISAGAMKGFLDEVTREFPDMSVEGDLDGSLGAIPERPKTGSQLRVIDQAALFVAPKASYFLVSDLEAIGSKRVDEGEAEEPSAVTALLTGAGQVEQADFSTTEIVRRKSITRFRQTGRSAAWRSLSMIPKRTSFESRGLLALARASR